jgi:gliding motility-associated-like protein
MRQAKHFSSNLYPFSIKLFDPAPFLPNLMACKKFQIRRWNSATCFNHLIFWFVKFKFLIFLFFIIQLSKNSNAGDLKLEWVKSLRNDDITFGVTNTANSEVDENGNVYSAGCFFDTLDFDPGPAAYELTGSLFIHKLDSSGEFLWAKSVMASARINDLALDVNNNIYVTGHFSGTADFDPGAGVFNLTCNGAITDIFILKLDASGNFIWARSMGGPEEDKGSSVTVDPSGNVYCCGHYNQSADLDPGPGVCNVITSNSTFFILKLNASGNFIWGKSMGFGDIFSYDDYKIHCDLSGNIYTTGRFDYTEDFDPGPAVYNLTATGLYTDVFIQKLDSSGNFIWAKSIEGTVLEVCRSFVIDANNNIYTTGFFCGTADFDPGPGILNLSSIYSAGFVQKLDADGNFLWAKFIGGDSASVFPGDIDTDTNNNAYVTGYFYDTIDFDPGPGVFNISPFENSTGMFILKLDTQGIFCWAKFMGGHDYFSVSNSIALDANNNIYTTGSFSDTVDFDPGPGVYDLTNAGSSDIFIQKLSQCGLISYDLGSDTTVCESGNFIIDGSIKNGSYVWQDNSTDSFFTPLQSDLYFVTATVGNCRISDSIFVEIDRPVTVDLGNDTILCDGEILKLSAGNTNANYLWQDNSTDSTFDVFTNGSYQVIVRNQCGINSDEINVIVENCECIFIPNSFTPNSDGLNDYFSSVSRCDLSEFNLTIFNRWGEKIFESTSPGNYWDGRYKEEFSPTGVYAYEVTYKSGKTLETIKRHGHISLIR